MGVSVVRALCCRPRDVITWSCSTVQQQRRKFLFPRGCKLSLLKHAHVRHCIAVSMCAEGIDRVVLAPPSNPQFIVLNRNSICFSVQWHVSVEDSIDGLPHGVVWSL